MDIYCLLCGSKLFCRKEIEPNETPMEYKQNGIVGVYDCSNEENCNATFHVIDLESDEIAPDDIYMAREIRYYFEDDLDL